MPDRSFAAKDACFSLVDDPLLRLQRALRLAPRQGFGGVGRALLFAGLTWLPVAIWATVTGHLPGEIEGDPALRHLGLHVRCLLGIPLLILSEPLADRVIEMIVANFVPSGLVRPEHRPEFGAVLRSVERWRDSKLVWLVMVAIVVASALTARQRFILEDMDAVLWGLGGASLDFGAAWALYVVRPLFLFLLLVWLWRLTLTWMLFRRISRLDLQVVASHPDRMGGLGFIGFHSVAFSLVVLAISSVVSSGVAHQMLNHGVGLEQFKLALGSLVVLLAVLFLLPLTAFVGTLRWVGVRAKLEYGTLAGRFVQGLHARWVEGKSLEDPILSADELGPAADIATLYGMGTNVKYVPIGKLQLVAILLPAALPVLCVASLEIPINDILSKILGMLT